MSGQQRHPDERPLAIIIPTTNQSLRIVCPFLNGGFFTQMSRPEQLVEEPVAQAARLCFSNEKCEQAGRLLGVFHHADRPCANSPTAIDRPRLPT